MRICDYSINKDLNEDDESTKTLYIKILYQSMAPHSIFFYCEVLFFRPPTHFI